MMCQLCINIFTTRIKEVIILWTCVLLSSSVCIYEKSENKKREYIVLGSNVMSFPPICHEMNHNQSVHLLMEEPRIF